MSSKPAAGCPEFGDLPEHIRISVFQEAWRDFTSWPPPCRHNAAALRLVSREACAAVSGLITSLQFFGYYCFPGELVPSLANGVGIAPGASSDDASMRPALFAAPGGGRFPALTALHLHSTHLSLEEMRTLVARALPALQELHLCTTRIAPAAARALAASAAQRFPVLQALWIDNCECGEAAEAEPVAALIEGMCWPTLAHVSVERCNLGAKPMVALAAAAPTALPALTSLHLSNNHINGEGVWALLAQAWPRLEDLNLSSNEIGFLAAVALADACAAGRLPALRALDCSINYLGGAGIRLLAAVSWPRLRRLLVSFDVGAHQEGAEEEEVTVEALAAAGAHRFPALLELWLSLYHSQGAARQRLVGVLEEAWPGIDLRTPDLRCNSYH